MKHVWTVATLLFAACAPVRSGPEPLPPMVPSPQVHALIGDRTALALTSEQVVELDSIAEALRRENRVLTQEIRRELGERHGGPIRPPRTEEERRAVLPLLERVSENNLAAMHAVGEVLSDEQRQRVCQMARQARSTPRGAPRRRPGAFPEPEPGAEPTDAVMDVRRRGWPWCPLPGVPGTDTLPGI